VTALADRIEALGITRADLAEIVLKPQRVVDDWLQAKTLPGEAKILLRFLADDHLATLQLQRIRSQKINRRDYRGEGMAAAEIDPDAVADRTPATRTGGAPQ
jgi:hypothetical protein